MLVRWLNPDPPQPQSGLSDSISGQLADHVEGFVSRRVQPLADEITGVFREQVARLVATNAVTSSSALALIGRTKRAILGTRRVVLAQAQIALSEQRVIAEAFGLEPEFLRLVRDSVDGALSQCRAIAADDIRPLLEQVFVDAPVREMALRLAHQRRKMRLRAGAARLGNIIVVQAKERQPSFSVLRGVAEGACHMPYSPFATTLRSCSIGQSRPAIRSMSDGSEGAQE
jgi:hypothetical protein